MGIYSNTDGYVYLDRLRLTSIDQSREKKTYIFYVNHVVCDTFNLVYDYDNPCYQHF